MDGTPEPQFLNDLRKNLQKAGFPLVGAVDLDLSEDLLSHHYSRYLEWLRLGFGAEMSYLLRGSERRSDPRKLMLEAESVVCVAWPYSKNSLQGGGPKFARYLRGTDYHETIKSVLEEVMSETSLKWKICVDTSAILERTWAALCGLGWIGKNTMLIHPKWGSYL